MVRSEGCSRCFERLPWRAVDPRLSLRLLSVSYPAISFAAASRSYSMGSVMTRNTARKRLAVIGGGASGSVALEEALEKGLEAQLFEARDEVGGAWALSEDPGACLVSFDADGQATLQAPGEGSAGPPSPTPMYPGLKTNVPSTLMEYRARPFPPTVVCLASQGTVTLSASSVGASACFFYSTRCRIT